jgi:ComF family protein
MFEYLDPRHFLARCVRCDLRGAPLCGGCAADPPALTSTPAGHRVFAIGLYTSAVGERVRRLKYGDETHLAYPLGHALRQLTAALAPTIGDALLVPVPLHPMRLASRGYNQSALVARAMVRHGGPRIALDLLHREAQGPSQAGLSGRERRANLVDGFAAPRRVAPGRPIFLVDDVVTTGSTIDACAAALKCAGLSIAGVFACAIADRGLSPPRPR